MLIFLGESVYKDVHYLPGDQETSSGQTDQLQWKNKKPCTSPVVNTSCAEGFVNVAFYRTSEGFSCKSFPWLKTMDVYKIWLTLEGHFRPVPVLHKTNSLFSLKWPEWKWNTSRSFIFISALGFSNTGILQKIDISFAVISLNIPSLGKNRVWQGQME